jgi:pimeloyl-ACP methyl ester carboxylesterase
VPASNAVIGDADVNATPVVLLPGMMLDARMFDDQVATLSRSREVVVGDLSQSDSIAEMARNVLRMAPSRFALIGLSMGGIVALEIWRQARDRVTHLGLLDTTPYAEKPERRALRIEQLAQVENGGLRDVLMTSMKPMYVAKRNRGDTALLQRILDMAVDLGPDVFRSQSLALRDRPDSTTTLEQIDCPSLVLCGREDALCPVEFHVRMAEALPAADLMVLTGCGHLSTMEAPATVSAALEHLLGRSS